MQNFTKFWKIAYLWARLSPRRPPVVEVGKNLMKRWGKEIFCRFQISNQIFHTNYGSRDIERSLDTTSVVENLTYIFFHLIIS